MRYCLKEMGGIMKRISLLLTAFLMFSCATTKKYERNLATWIGSDINQLIMVWGLPSNQTSMPNGDIAYTWLWVGQTLIPSKEYESTLKRLAFETTSGINWCRTTFYTNKEQKIINYSFSGSYCKAK